MSGDADSRDLSGDPYALTSPSEIIGVLRTIVRSRAMLQLRVPPSVASVVTALLHVDAGALVLDNPGEALMRRIVRAEQVILETSLDQVRVHFRLAGIEPHVHEGREALRARLPTHVLRMQRRDAFRVPTSAARPVLCRIPVDGREVALPLDDIGAGGVGLFDDAGALPHARGAVIKGCRIDLPDVGPVTVDLRVMQAREIELPNGKVRHRLGCCYDGDLGRAQQTIQRYVSQLEREAIARRRGLA